MKVGLLGFGKAGKAVASILLLRKETELVWVLKKTGKSMPYSVPEFLGVESDEPGLIFSKTEWTAKQLLDKYPVDVIVDFSSKDGISFYGEEARKREIAIITAISEYPEDQIHYIEQLSKDTKVLWSPNITIGINFLMIAAKILQKIAPYTDIEIIEEHFKDKKEISGTAKKIANSLSISTNDIKSIRAGGIIGRHEVLFGFPYQTVRLLHESISREAFGNGALFAALAIVNKEKGLYSMEDLLLPYFSLES